MKHIQNDRHKTNPGSRLIAILFLSLLSILVSSCSAIAGIFEAGMGFGMFMVLAVFVIIAFIILRFRQNNK